MKSPGKNTSHFIINYTTVCFWLVTQECTNPCDLASQWDCICLEFIFRFIDRNKEHLALMCPNCVTQYECLVYRTVKAISNQLECGNAEYQHSCDKLQQSGCELVAMVKPQPCLCGMIWLLILVSLLLK